MLVGETRGEECERNEGNIFARACREKKRDGAFVCELRTSIFSDRSAREAFFNVKIQNPSTE